MTWAQVSFLLKMALDLSSAIPEWIAVKSQKFARKSQPRRLPTEFPDKWYLEEDVRVA